MTLGDLVSIYTELLLRWGPVAAMHGTAALIARDASSRWFEVDN